MQPDELKTVLENHRKWLWGEGGKRANLRDADLIGADLSGADLSGARLWSTIGNGREIRTLQTDIWTVTYTADVIQIGCRRHEIEAWWAFSDDEIDEMAPEALDWWRRWKPLLQQIIETSPAIPTRAAAANAA